MEKISDILNYGVKDIITLSDIQTQLEFNNLEVDFTIVSTRKYKHPDDIFSLTCYIASYQASRGVEAQQIMLVVRQIEKDFDLRVYYLDSDGPSDNFEAIFEKDGNDLIDRFDVDLHFDSDTLPVTWDKQGQSTFGVECSASESSDVLCKTIATYFTNDDTRGNPHCFIEWTGDKFGGYIEIWYGCEIQNTDIEMFHTKI